MGMERAQKRTQKRLIAFTLIELLAVVAIILLLLSLLVPTLSAARNRASRVNCRSNLHQVHAQLTVFASTYGQFPTNNNWNCTNFRSPIWKLINSQFREAGIGEKVFYCPSLAKQNPSRRGTDAWYKAPDANDEILIGYAYLGNPIQGRKSSDLYKYAGPYDGASNLATYVSDLNERFVMMADICSASRSYSAATADLVPTQGWGDFPHDGIDARAGCNVLTAAGAVHWRTLPEMTMNWQYDAPVDMYW